MAKTLFRQWLVIEAQDDWEIENIGNLGEVITGKECITNQQINSLIVKNKNVSVEYVYQYLKSSEVRVEL